MRDRALGALLVAGAAVALVVYVYGLIFFTILALQIVAFIAVAAVCVILGWIGYTLITTPPPVQPEITPTQQTEGAAQAQPQTSTEPESKQT